MATTLKLQNSDGVKVYSVAGGKIIPSWLSESKKKQLRKDEEYRKRIELIQDFEFPSACQRIKITPDGQYIFATGYHAPRVRVYDLSQLVDEVRAVPGCRDRRLSDFVRRLRQGRVSVREPHAALSRQVQGRTIKCGSLGLAGTWHTPRRRPSCSCPALPRKSIAWISRRGAS